MDLVGPLPRAPGQRKFLIVAINYFSKWVEAEPLVTIATEKVKQFIWRSIICRYNVPESIVTDNGAQFASHDFQDYCAKYRIKVKYASVEYLQCNGQVEAVNKTIVKGLKKRLDDTKGRWPNESNDVLWAHRTVYKTATGETPYNLVYGVDAVIPAEVSLISHRVANYELEENSSGMRQSRSHR